MVKRKRYTWFFILVVLAVFYISFMYMERTEISDIDILLVVGIDKVDNEYRVSGLYNKNGGVDKASDGAKIIEGRGRSFYEAYNDLEQKNLKNVSIAHTTFYIFGEGAAREGMSQCLDFIEREQTVKTNALIYLYEGESVNELMKKSVKQKNQLNEDLNGISQKQMDQLKVVDNTVNEVTEFLERDNYNIFIPYLTMDDDQIYINGYGVIKDDELVTFLDRNNSITLDFIRNRVRTYPIYLENQVGLQITDSQVSSNVKIVNGAIKVIMNVLFESDVKEVTSTDHVFESYYMNQLEKQQNQYMKDQIENLIDVAKEYQLDITNSSEKIRNTYINDWETISSHWNKYFSNIIYDYRIESQTGQSYVLGS